MHVVLAGSMDTIEKYRREPYVFFMMTVILLMKNYLANQKNAQCIYMSLTPNNSGVANSLERIE